MLEPEKVQLSPMQKTWILDLDGTIVVHDGPYILGRDQFLPGAEEFLASIPPNDGAWRVGKTSYTALFERKPCPL